MTTLALVGCGSWGRNLVRVFDDLATVRWCCHTGSTENREWMQTNYPGVSMTTEYRRVLDDPAVDAVAIATPIDTHYDLVRRALRAGKHVFVEKPVTVSTERANELVALADDADRHLFVGYVFVYHPVFRQLASIHETDPIEALYFDWRKTGGFSADIVANLGSHDFAMARRLTGSRPTEVRVVHETRLYGGRNVVSIAAAHDDGPDCRIDLNRLAPDDRKTVTFVTASGNLFVWTGMRLERLEPAATAFEGVFEGDREPLAEECGAFIDAVENGSDPVTDGAFGRDVTAAFADILED